MRNAKRRREWISEMKVYIDVLENWEHNHDFLKQVGESVLRQIIKKAVKELLQWGETFRKITA